jgi:hypothetical protein
MFLVKLDANGTAVTSKGFADASPTSLAVTSLGEIIVAGSYDGPVNFGGDPLPDGFSSIFVASFTPSLSMLSTTS